jgi:hypothetical protein
MGIKVMGLNLGYMGGDKELLVFPHPNYILIASARSPTGWPGRWRSASSPGSREGSGGWPCDMKGSRACSLSW